MLLKPITCNLDVRPRLVPCNISIIINKSISSLLVGYLQPFLLSNSPQTYYLLYFTTSLQNIPPPITPSLQPFPHIYSLYILSLIN